MRVYLDNAATTPLAPEVLQAMMPFWFEDYGNPSSIHGHGRRARAAIEKARKKIAERLNAAPSEIFFTSCGTEADNWAIKGAVTAFGIKHLVSTKLEHHAVLHTLQNMERLRLAQLHWLPFDSKGVVDLEQLGNLLQELPQGQVLVSLMHGNNEVGNLLPLAEVSQVCAAHGALFHSDMVQTVGHYEIDVQATPLSFLAASAHKFHGPKGVGFIYINPENKVPPLLHGGAQERNLRGGTENVASIMGMAAALDLALDRLETDRQHLLGLKQRLMDRLIQHLPGVGFNGNCQDLNHSLYTVLNVLLPPSPYADMILMKLDIEQISVSGGSACTSGSLVGSHVLDALGTDPNRGAIRFSLGRQNTVTEIDYSVDRLVTLI
ncbi:MAG: cysteine desulfurase [Cytophagales bacterium]|nr:cysteine desulfurase [Cytophagales bacterium]